jgi:hypothetical protein
MFITLPSIRTSAVSMPSGCVTYIVEQTTIIKIITMTDNNNSNHTGRTRGKGTVGKSRMYVYWCNSNLDGGASARHDVIDAGALLSNHMANSLHRNAHHRSNSALHAVKNRGMQVAHLRGNARTDNVLCEFNRVNGAGNSNAALKVFGRIGAPLYVVRTSLRLH